MSESVTIVTPEETQKIKKIVSEHKNMQGSLIPILHEVQEYYGYLPYEVQKLIAEELDIPVSEVYGVVSFYTRFKMTPVGKYKISVCLGTACYVKGADKIIDEIKNEIKIEEGQTSADKLYTLEATRCIGACGLAPVMTVNEDVYGKVEPGQVKEIIAKYLDE